MQVSTIPPAPVSSPRIAPVLTQSLGRLAGPSAFLNELMRAVARQPHLQSGQASGEPLRPIAFIPLTGPSPSTPAGTTSKGKGRKKKSSGATSDGALEGLIGRR